MFIALWPVIKESSHFFRAWKTFSWKENGMIWIHWVIDISFVRWKSIKKTENFWERSKLKQNLYEVWRLTLKPVLLCLNFLFIYLFFITIPWKVLLLTLRNAVVHPVFLYPGLKNLAKLVNDLIGCWSVALQLFFFLMRIAIHSSIGQKDDHFSVLNE